MNGRHFWMVVAATIFATAAVAQQTVSRQAAVQQAQATQRLIVVSLEDRKLALIENGEVKKIYSVAVGKPSTPSPEGTFTILRRAANPTYSHDGKTVAPGPGNPVGSRWMGLSKAGYGIHGTNEPKSIGKAASHGCIRMSKADVEEFYRMVAVGDTVRLIGHRDEETARLFDPAGTPAPWIALEPLEDAYLDAVPLTAASADKMPVADQASVPVNATGASAGTR